MKRIISVITILGILISFSTVFAETESKTVIATDSCEVVFGNTNNRNTIYVYNNASMPIYALYKLDISDLPRSGRIASVKLKIKVNGVRSGTVSYVAAKKSEVLDWGERENGYSFKGTEGFKENSKIPNLGEQLGETVVVDKAGTYYFDITSYVKEKKDAGEEALVVGLENIGTAEALFYCFSTSSGDSDSKPAFEIELIPAEETADIKEIKLSSGAIITPPFDKNITEYTVAYPDETEEVPVISYVPEGEYSTGIENSPAKEFGEETVITLASEAGGEKTYRFRIVRYSDLGVSPQGKITYATPVISEEGGKIAVNLSAQSLSTLEKTVYILTTVMKEKETVISAREWRIYTGVNEMKLALEPSENASVCVVEDLEKFVPLTDSAYLMENNDGFKEREELTLSFAELSSERLVVSGKGEKDGLYGFTVLKKGESRENITADNITAVMCENVRADEKGYFSFGGVIYEDGEFVVYGTDSSGETVFEKEFYHATAEKRRGLANGYSESGSLKTDMEISEGSEAVKSFLIEKSIYENISGDYFYKIFENILHGSEAEDKLYAFSEAFPKAVKADMLNSGKINDISIYSREFELSEKSLELYGKLTDELKRRVSSEGLKGRNFESIKAVDEVFYAELLLCGINEPDSLAGLISFIEEEYGELGISLASYNRLSAGGKTKLAEYIWECSFDTLSDFEDKFTKKVKELSAVKPSSGGGGGGGGGAPVKMDKELAEKPQPPAEAFGDAKAFAFKDMAGYEWAEEAVEFLFGKGIISGKAEGIFAPSHNITRGEFAKIICLASGIDSENSNCTFDDMKDHWAYKYVGALYEKGYVNGISDTLFGVENPVTREDAAVIIHRICGGGGEADFADKSEISEYAVKGVSALSAKGFINGYEDGTFRPKNTLKRAEAAVILSKILKAEEER